MSPADRLFRTIHQRLIDALQSGRSEEAYAYTWLLAYVAPRLEAYRGVQSPDRASTAPAKG